MKKNLWEILVNYIQIRVKSMAIGFNGLKCISSVWMINKFHDNKFAFPGNDKLKRSDSSCQSKFCNFSMKF